MKEHTKWKYTFLTGLCITLVSEIYWNLFYDGFRVSLSVALFPILLLTLDLDLSTLWIGFTSGTMIFLFRGISAWIGQDTLAHAFQTALPGGLYYVFYSFLFYLAVRNKHTVKFSRLIFSVLCCDFFSNWLESYLWDNTLPDQAHSLELLVIAVVRTTLVGFTLMLIANYHSLLARKEHEQRYQRLFLMTAELKNEIYFMKKNSEEIEKIMSNAYRLYESLADQQVKPQVQDCALAIARDVHEIKKDYLGIIKGLEQEVNDEYPETEMKFSDLLTILREFTYAQIDSQNLSIFLDFQCRDDFLTQAHYSLMLILKNLVNNAVEAIGFDRKKGHITIVGWRDGDDYRIRVCDDGPGISEKNLSKVFQHGFSTKFDRETGNIYRGVGLSGVKSVVEEQFHGSIDVTSQPNVKTEFQIRIPTGSLEEKK